MILLIGQFLHENRSIKTDFETFLCHFIGDVNYLAWPDPRSASLRLQKHPDKTYIGRIEKGFDWLGYNIRPDGLRVAAKTLANFVSRVHRLYEREPGEVHAFSRLGVYVQRWVRWVRGGLGLHGPADPHSSIPDYENSKSPPVTDPYP